MKKPTALLIEWQLLSILRSSEAVSIEWADIDWESKALHIPAERMKGGKRPHSIPLSSQALNVLDQMRRYTGNRKYVFCSRIAPFNKPMNSGAANVALKRMGFKDLLVAHGLRSIASTYLQNWTAFHLKRLNYVYLMKIGEKSAKPTINRRSGSQDRLSCNVGAIM